MAMNGNDIGVGGNVGATGNVTLQTGYNPSTAPGAAGPGGNMAVTTAVVWIIGGSAVTLFVLGWVFRKGGK